MLNFYIFFTSLLYPIIRLAPLLNKRAKAFLQKRSSDKAKIKSLQIPKACTIWLHAASVGELDQCKSQAKALKENEPSTRIIQSIFSDSVQEKNFDTENTFFTFRLPLDFYFAYDFIFEKFHPEVLILMAWDTWPNLILAANRHKCKVYLASAVLDPRSKRNSPLVRLLTKSVFSRLQGISPVNESMISAFADLSGSDVKIISCGDSRFDSVVDKIKIKKPNDSFIRFAESYHFENILILASTYSECEKVILPALPEILNKNYAVWIFPHKIEPSRIEEISNKLQVLNQSFSIYSEIKSPCKDRIVLFDVLGILAFAYFYGKIAYVGGAMHNKIHNVLEPAFFGLPLLSGSKIFNSYDALKMQEQKSLITINTSEEILEAVRILSNRSIRDQVSAANKQYVISRLEASTRFYNTFLKK